MTEPAPQPINIMRGEYDDVPVYYVFYPIRGKSTEEAGFITWYQKEETSLPSLKSIISCVALLRRAVNESRREAGKTPVEGNGTVLDTKILFVGGECPLVDEKSTDGDDFLFLYHTRQLHSIITEICDKYALLQEYAAEKNQQILTLEQVMCARSMIFYVIALYEKEEMAKAIKEHERSSSSTSQTP